MRLHNTHSRGFSLVELMVAMLIALIGTVVIFQVFEVSEGIKRTTTSGGDAQQNGAVSLYVIERDLRNAGMGFSDVNLAGCNILAFDSSRTTQNFTLTLAPVLITPGGTATTPDQLTVFYGSQPLIGNSTQITASVAAPGTAAVPVKNSYGYNPGDLIVLLQPSSGKDCSLMEATQIGDATGSNTVFHVSGGGYAGKTARFNKSGGLLVGYDVDPKNIATTRVFNLGNLYTTAAGTAGGSTGGTSAVMVGGNTPGPNLPVNNTYFINANSLAVTSAFALDSVTGKAPATTTAADNIVHMRVQYGLDDGQDNGSVKFAGTFKAGDGLVDRWVSGATFNAIAPAPWISLVAMRLAVVARSALAERPSGSDGANCDATTDGTESTPGPDRRPLWSGSGMVGGVLDVSASGDPSPTSPLYWKCYRYRVFETTVPLRNWIWKSSSQ